MYFVKTKLINIVLIDNIKAAPDQRALRDGNATNFPRCGLHHGYRQRYRQHGTHLRTSQRRHLLAGHHLLAACQFQSSARRLR